MQGNQVILDTFRGTAERLTSSPGLREQLLQETALHLERLRGRVPDRPADWYLRACTLHGRAWLRRQQNARQQGETPPPPGAVGPNGDDDPLAILDAVVGHGQEEWVRQRLTTRQAEVFDLLLAGHGLRDIGRQLSISHVAVIKLRRKIARNAQQVLGGTSARPAPAATPPGAGYGLPARLA